MKLLNQASEMVDVQALTPHPRNVNIGNMNAITESIHESGFYGGIVAQRSTGFILAGNHRYQAAVQLGATQIPVHWVDVDSKQALKIMLGDNQISALAHRDDEALAALLSELQLTDSLIGTGYVDADLDALLAGMTVPDFQPSDEPPPRLDEKKKVTCPACEHEFTP